jgi:hypothetical protein
MNINKLYRSAAFRNTARLVAEILFMLLLGAVGYFGWLVAAVTGV